MLRSNKPEQPRRILFLAAAFVLLAACLAWAQSDLFNRQIAALERSNEYRRSAGLSEVVLDDRLNAAAQGHADYLGRNDFIGHTQERSRSGFTGEDPGARTTAAGYRWMVIMEDVTGETEPERAVDSLISSVYHRMPFINDEVRDAGFGFSSRAAVLLFGATRRRSPARDIVLLPGDGATAVPTAWTAREFPNPLPEGTRLPVGCPVSLSFPAAKRVELNEAVLETANGTEVESIVLTPDNDPNGMLKRDIFLIPKKPLRRNNGYVARFQVAVDGSMKTRTWFFTTGGR